MSETFNAQAQKMDRNGQDGERSPDYYFFKSKVNRNPLHHKSLQTIEMKLAMYITTGKETQFIPKMGQQVAIINLELLLG